MSNKRIISIEVPIELYQSLVKLSKEDDRSLSAYIRRILDNYLKNLN